MILLLETPDSADAQDPANIQRSEREDVRPVVQFCRKQAVSPAVPRQKVDLASTQRARNKRVRWSPKGRIDHQFFGFLESFNLVQSAAANNPNRGRSITHAGEE